MTKQNKSKTISKKESIFNSSPLLWGMGLAVFSMLIYINTLGHGFTVDDPLVISENKWVQQGISSLGKIWSGSYLEGYNGQADAAYRPISLTQFAIGKSFFGGKPGMMHFWHILFYGIGIFLCYQFSHLLFRGNHWLAAGAVILYASHPIHTEVVNNLKSRDELMMMLGVMGMCYYYMSYLKLGNKKALFFSFLFYLLSLFSKETSVTFFLLIPSLYMLRKERWSVVGWKHTALFMGASLFYLMIRTMIVGQYGVELDYMNNALLSAGSGGYFERLPDAVGLVGRYVLLLFYPHPLSVDYSYNSIPMQGWSNIYFYVTAVGIVGCVFLFIHQWKRNPLISFFIAWFFITIAIASNLIVLIGSTFAERFLFVPSFAFCAAIAYAICALVKENSKMILGICAMISIIYSIKTWTRNSDWKNDRTLFTKDVIHQQNNARVLTFHGKFIYDDAKELKDKQKAEGLLLKAKQSLDKAVTIAPEYMVANYYRGFVHKSLNENKLASDAFGKTVEIDSTFKNARMQYAISLSKINKEEEAIKQYLELMKQGENSFNLKYNLANAYRNIKDYKNSERLFLDAYALQPDNEALLSKLIRLYRDDLKNMPEAIKYNDLLKKLKRN